MAIFCLPKNKVKELNKSALKGEINITELYNMNSQQRRDFFIKHTDKELGKFLNTQFEKAMISKEQSALTDWAKSVFKPEMQTKPAYKNIIDKINELENLGVLGTKEEDIFLQDLVAEKLGITVSSEEIDFISKRAKIIDEAQKKLGNDLGNPNKTEENLKFFKAKKEMDDYLQSLTPSHKLRVVTGVIGRGMMLASLKSPILNIGSNIEVGFTEALARRMADGTLKGSDNKLAINYVKMVNKIYQATGYDISRMTSLSDTGASGSRVLGDERVHTQGTGKIRRIGRIVEDIVFKQLMGAPDVAFSSSHFADSVNLNSLKIAKGNVEKGKQIMNDAMLLAPQTLEGEVIRAQGIMDAQKATWTDRSKASQVAEGLRGILNKVSGDIRLGDYLLPFVKTPANVIATSMDYAGMGIPKALVKTIKAMREGNALTKTHWNNVSRDLVRSGLGITAAVIITYQLKDDDFVGAYDPNRAQIEALRNSNTNSFRIGNKWISTDWLGPLSVPVSAMMYARKYGETGGEKTFQYGKGVLSSIKNIPGIKDIMDYAQTQVYNKKTTLTESVQESTDYLTSEIYSRLIPSFLSDIAKATDSYERKTDKGLGGIAAKIPFARQALPIKTNIFGEQMMGESALSDIMFGARARTDRDNAIISEIRKVSMDNDKAINFTNWDTTSNKSLAQFKQKVGDEKYEETKVKYGIEVKKQLDKLFNGFLYKKMDDAEKLKAINAVDTEAMDKVLSKEHFTYKKDKIYQVSSGIKEPERNLVQLAIDYSKAYQIDPVNAFKAMFTQETLGKVKGNLVELNRFGGIDYKSPGGSEEYVKNELQKLGIPWEDRAKYNLEHITPVKAGGASFDSNNLYIVDRATHDSYSPVDTLAAKQIQNGKITRGDVTKIMKALKVDKSINVKEAERQLNK